MRSGSPGDRLRALLGRDRLSRDIDEEFEAHIAHRIDDLVAEGMAPDEARRRAETEFGDRRRLRRASLDARREGVAPRRSGLLTGAARDLVQAARALRRNPAFTGVAAATLVLGVGASVAIVSVVRAVVLDPLPFQDPDRLVALSMRTPAGDPFSTAEPAFLEWRAGIEAFDEVAAFSTRTETLRDPGEPRAVVRGYGSAGLLEMLGVEPRLGRTVAPAEDRPGAPAAVALLGHELWTEAFGGQDDIVGATLNLDGRTFEVIGVLPPGLEVLFGREVGVLTPLAADPAMDRGEHYLDVVARLAPGATPDRARGELERLVAWQSDTYPADRGWSAALEPLDEALLGVATIRAGWVLLGAAALLLAMACLNVSNLLLARATARQGEMAVRTVLGAGRWTLVRQLIAESAALATLGSAVGAAAAAAALPLVRSLGAGRIPRLDQAGLDLGTLAAAFLAVVAATTLFGLAPALTLRSGRPGQGLRSSGRGGWAPGAGARRILVGVQVAASVVLLLGSGLLFRSFLRLSSVDPGFEARGRLAIPLSMPDAAYDWRERGPLLQEILRRGREVAGVEALGATAVDPFSGYALANFVARNDRLPDRAEDFTPIHWRVVTPGFFDAMGMELRAGRAFEDADDGSDGFAVVIGEGLAERLYGDAGAAVGRTLVWGNPEGSRLRVVGVVEQLRDVVLDEAPALMIYRPHLALPWASMTLVARVRAGAEATAAEGLRTAVRTAAPGLAVPEVRSLEANLDRALAAPRFNLLLLTAFAAVGLGLAVVGLYGLTAFEVRRRFREIGIRMSLGARPDELVREFVARRVVVAGLGLGAGLLAAFFTVRWLDALLFETSAFDPVTWAVVPVVVGGTTLLAAWIPARRASRVDPREVLSVE